MLELPQLPLGRHDFHFLAVRRFRRDRICGVSGAPKLRNLALAGGSPLTGLEIIAIQPQLPSFILVEANVLARGTDAALVERYSRGVAEPLFSRPVRAAVAAYEQRIHAPLTHEQVSLELRRLVGQPPSDFDNRSMQIARCSNSMRRIRRMRCSLTRNGLES